MPHNKNRGLRLIFSAIMYIWEHNSFKRKISSSSFVLNIRLFVKKEISDLPWICKHLCTKLNHNSTWVCKEQQNKKNLLTSGKFCGIGVLLMFPYKVCNKGAHFHTIFRVFHFQLFQVTPCCSFFTSCPCDQSTQGICWLSRNFCARQSCVAILRVPSVRFLWTMNLETLGLECRPGRLNHL